MPVRLRATGNFDYEEMKECDVTIEVFDSNANIQGTVVKTFLALFFNNLLLTTFKKHLRLSVLTIIIK